jgi:LPS-assembly protein
MFRFVVVLAVTAAGLIGPRAAAAQDSMLGSCKSTIRPTGQTPEAITDRPAPADALRFTFVGTAAVPVVITCDDMVLQARTIVFETDTQDIRATGEVLLQQRDLRVFAERAEMNSRTKLGVFYEANGIARIGDAPAEKSPFGTLESDVIFRGRRLEKAGPKTYKLNHGAFTTCAQPVPRWEMTMGNATITIDERAILTNVVLRVKDVPLFYLPAFYYPMKKEDRSTGFLLPTYGASNLRGTSLSNAFFWAISRSQDATFFHDWTSKFGQGYGSEYRYVRSAGSRGAVKFFMTNTPGTTDAETGATSAASQSYDINGDLNQALPRNFRLIGRMNYFTDIATQQLYQDVYQSDQRQRRDVTVNVSGSIARTRITASAEQHDYFYSRADSENGVARSSRQRNGRMPSVNLSMPDRSIGSSKVYVGGSAQAGYLIDQQDLDDPATKQNLFRFDGGPTVRAPLSTLSFLSATADASWRITHWSKSYQITNLDDPTDDRVQVPIGLTRQLFNVEASMTGPVLARIFPTRGVKHVIEPRFSIGRMSSFSDRVRVVEIDSVDTLVGGTTTVNYGLINRILVRGAPAAPGRRGQVREVASVSITQSYYTEPLASIYDPAYSSNLNATASSFSPLSIRASFRPNDQSSGDLRMDIDSKYKAIRTMSGTLRGYWETGEVSAEWSKRFVIPGLSSFKTGRHFLSAGTTIRSRNNHLGGSYRFSFDVQDREFVDQRIGAYYNSQCCGVSVDWQSMDTPLWLPQGVPTNTQFAISFTLAGIGSFSNPLGSFGGR